MANNNQNVPQPVEPMSAGLNSTTEPMYQPLSEQAPIVQPTNPINSINKFGSNISNNQMSQTIEPLPQSMNNNIPNNIMSNNIIPTQNIFNQQAAEHVQTQNPIPTPVNMNQQPVINNMAINNVTPVNPKPVVPEQIPTPSENTIPSPIPTPQPTMPQPVGFVFGPQQGQNNNQQM